VLDKAIIGVMLATAVVMWIFVPGSTASIFVVLGIATIVLASAMKKNGSGTKNPSRRDSNL
jgi:hypothetical protein